MESTVTEMKIFAAEVLIKDYFKQKKESVSSMTNQLRCQPKEQKKITMKKKEAVQESI